MDAPPTRTAPPRRLGPYLLEQELGRGGMAVVCRARDERSGDAVALKAIRVGGVGDRDLVTRVRREAQAATAFVGHEGIVGVLDVGEAEGYLYLAMELIDGESLDRRIARGPLPPRDAAALVAQVARAAHAAHVRGLVHGDIKPGNILVGFRRSRVAGGAPESVKTPAPAARPPDPAAVAEGEARAFLSDFGLARHTDTTPTPVPGRGARGTPAYMSPEQARGQAGDPRSDVWALGVTLYACLAGAPPFPGATGFAVLERVLHGEPAPLTAVRPDTPAPLAAIAMRCLGKSPGRRYATAAALADDLDRYLRGGSPHLGRGWLGRLWARVRRSA